MHRVLVTGGLGFIGSNLINILINQKFKVINIDKVSYASNFYNTKEISNKKNYKFIKCDIKNNKKIDSILKKSIDQIVFSILLLKHT